MNARQQFGSWFAPLLPNEPRILDPQTQAKLTVRYLLPALPQLAACLLTVRHRLDVKLAQLQPIKLGKPYPLGQCLEIAEAVHTQLRTVDENSLPEAATAGLRALRAFQRAGGDFRQVWGDLRGQYFQNAFQLGTLYVDVANDTVNPNKPKVEILPFEAAQFVPIRDFTHFGDLASRYWGQQVYPNNVLPHLAPHCPLVLVGEHGRIMVHEATQYMLALARSGGFERSEVVLSGLATPDEVFQRARAALKNAGFRLPANPEVGRKLALEQCRIQRAKRKHFDKALTSQIIREVSQVNLLLLEEYKKGRLHANGL